MRCCMSFELHILLESYDLNCFNNTNTDIIRIHVWGYVTLFLNIHWYGGQRMQIFANEFSYEKGCKLHNSF